MLSFTFALCLEAQYYEAMRYRAIPTFRSVGAVLFAAAAMFFLPALMHAEPLVFASYPFGDPVRVQRGLSPLVEYLSAATGTPMRLVVTRDYQELSRRLGDGTVDFAWIGSANYARTRISVPSIQYIATYLEWDRDRTERISFYRAVILARADSDFETLESLRGTRFGFTDRDSTAGYAYPRMMLTTAGFDYAEFFRSVFFLGTHENVIRALLAGSLDAGAVSDGTLLNAQTEHGDRFRVLAWSPPIPLDAVIAAEHVPPALVTAVRNVLVALPPDHPVHDAIERVFGWPAAGFNVMPESFYEPVFRALELRDR